MTSVQSLVETLAAPRTVWVMLPAGTVTEDMVRQLAGLMKAGEARIDVPLNDSLTSFRLVAIADAAPDRFGTGFARREVSEKQG